MSRKLARVLVLDDDPGALRALCRLLEVYEVVRTPSPKMALEALAGEEKFDAIVCDVNMPEMDGVTFYRNVRAQRPELRYRFVFVSGDGTYASDLYLEAHPVLIKPVSRADLRSAVEEVLVSSSTR